MPTPENLKLVIANQIQDLKSVRLQGIDKPFDKLTIGELVQLRPGSTVADTYDITAVTDNATINTSSRLAELGRIHSIRTMQKVVHQQQLDNLRGTLAPRSFSPLSPQSGGGPGPGSVSMPNPEEDVFNTQEGDPFAI